MILAVDKLFTNEQVGAIRQSAISAGFGTWQAPTALIGNGLSEGMSFFGDHASPIKAITEVMSRPIYPSKLFFRILTGTTQKRYIHSDRNEGQFTAILYLSEHGEDVSGTAFYKHKSTNRIEMPSLEEMQANGELESMSKDMTENDDAWEQMDFIRGAYGRMLIFSAPLFHGRFPLHGLGTTPEDARMIWVCHFSV